MEASLKNRKARFWPDVDGYFYPEDPWAIYAAGKQAHVPLLAGWNAEEQDYTSFLGKAEPTPKAYAAKVHAEYGENPAEVLKLFPGNTEEQVKQSARELASARFIAYSTWKWINMQLKTGGSPVYRYHFEQVTPSEPGKKSRGAFHSSDIQFVFETQDSENLPWSADDRKMSDIMSSYWTNFAKSGDPNGAGLPQWPQYDQKTDYAVMHLQLGASTKPHAAPSAVRAQYELLDRIARENRNKTKSGS